MSSKCDKCLVEFSSADITAKCIECKHVFHPACTHAGSTQNFTKTKTKSWKCDSCEPSHESVDKKFFVDALTSMKTDIISKMDARIGVVQDAIVHLSEDMKSLATKFTSLEERLTDLSARCDQLEKTSSHVNEEVQEIQQKLQDLEQHSRCANIEIVGLAMTPSENIFSVLEQIAKAIDVPFKRDDISMAHRLRLYSKRHAHPPIIVQFVSRSQKEAWIAAAKFKRRLCASEVSSSLPSGTVYINHHLTSTNKALLGRARRLAREKKLYFAGFTNGKVLVKPKEEDRPIRVVSLEELDRYDK